MLVIRLGGVNRCKTAEFYIRPPASDQKT